MQRLARLSAGAVLVTGMIAAPAGIAAGEQDGSGPPPDEQFQKVTLNGTPNGELIDLAVLPDERVLYTTRQGEVWMHDPDTGRNLLSATLDVYRHDEEGLQSVAIDPEFDGKKNRWVYLYYSPPLDTPIDDPTTPEVNEGDAPLFGDPEDFEPFEGHIQLSRFELVGNELDLSSEQKILEVPVDRGICCHVGGDIVFDSEGNLYLSTGDDTNPFASGGFAPIDDRPGRNPAYDARRTAANTNDLRGKVLRITVQPDGSYTTPDGNMFQPGTPGTRPEIYVMGLRNPFRIDIDPHTDALYVADYSPDARSADPDRGPAGHGKWMVITEPANYGWPFCATAELPYVDFDFATEESGEPFNCDAPVNDSPHNTGLTELPPVAQPDVWYSYDLSEEFPELETGGIGPMGGPAYDFDVKNTRGRAPVAWPEYYDGVPLFHEWTRDYVKAMHLDENGDLAAIEDVLASIAFDNPMDIEFGPNGALYTLEYGDGFFRVNPEAQLARIDYIGPGGNHAPTVQAMGSPTQGQAPLTVEFSSEGTMDEDGDRLRYEWDFDSDGKVDSRDPNPTHTYTENGVYRANLQVTDIGGRHRGKSASTQVEVIVGQEPVVEFVAPSEGDTFHFGDAVEFEVSVTDDQPVDCANVVVTYSLGHDQHDHDQTTALGCSGTIQTLVPSGHDPGVDDLSGVFAVNYTDPSGLTGIDQVVLEPTTP